MRPGSAAQRPGDSDIHRQRDEQRRGGNREQRRIAVLDPRENDIYGARRHWRFQPFWLRIELEEHPDESNRLLLASHGRRLVIADFLGAPMRRELAATLRTALQRWRAALNPANGEP